MIPRIVFRPSFSACPECWSRLMLYRTKKRHVISTDCDFTAVIHIMMCRNCHVKFSHESINRTVRLPWRFISTDGVSPRSPS